MNLPLLPPSVFASPWVAILVFLANLHVGTNILSVLDAREVDRGHPPHPGAYVVIATPAGHLKGVPLSEAAAYPAQHPGATFLLPPGPGKVSNGDAQHTLSFSASPLTPQSQLIEAKMHAETSTFIRYVATSSEIRPQYTRIWYPGFMFAAMPCALLVAMAVYWLGRLARSQGSSRAPAAPWR
jgi:hypothetical protein